MAIYDDLPFHVMSAGLRTSFGTVTPPAGRVAAYVRSTGAQSDEDLNISNMLVTTLNAGLARCRSGMNDIVFVMPGHTESISGADAMSSLVAGTKIVGLGSGNTRPTFTWTAAAATFLLDVNDVEIHNCRLLMAGALGSTTALTVTAPMTITGVGCGLFHNEINFAVDADQLATIAMKTTAAADYLSLVGNHVWGATLGEVTTAFDIIGADNLFMADNVFEGATSNTAVGIVRFATTASLYIQLLRNTYINRKASSTCAVTGLANVSGVSREEHFAYLNTTSLTPWLTSTGIMTFHRPTVTNTAGETGTEVVGTVTA